MVQEQENETGRKDDHRALLELNDALLELLHLLLHSFVALQLEQLALKLIELSPHVGKLRQSKKT